MSILDAQIIANVLDEFGNTITVTEVTISFGTDEYRTESESTTAHTGIKSFVQILTAADDLVKEGRFKAGDCIFWFKSSDASYIVTGNRITHNSLTYEISDVVEYRIGDSVYVVEARTKQV